jgi:hypothetical protein
MHKDGGSILGRIPEIQKQLNHNHLHVIASPDMSGRGDLSFSEAFQIALSLNSSQ